MARFPQTARTIFVAVALSLCVLAGCGDGEPSSGPSVDSSRSFTRNNWGELAAAPDSFEGARVDIVGQVLGDPTKSGDTICWQMWPHPTNIDWMAVVEFEDASFLIADGDYVHVLGTVRGKTEGEIPMLAMLDAVAVRAETAEVVDQGAVAPPALRTVDVAQTIEQHGLSVTLEKVEFAAIETRVYVTVSNQSTANAAFYDHRLNALQSQTQYEVEPLTYLPQVQADLPPGAVSSGVILFPALDPAQATELTFDTRTDDYQLEFVPYVFVIGVE